MAPPLGFWAEGEYLEKVVMTPVGISQVKKNLGQTFDIKDLGCLKYFLGIEDFGMLGCKPASTPMNPNVKLTLESSELLDDPGKACIISGCLIYLTNTKLDLTFATMQELGLIGVPLLASVLSMWFLGLLLRLSIRLWRMGHMQSSPTKHPLEVEREENVFDGSTFSDHLDKPLRQHLDVAYSEVEEDYSAGDEDNQSSEIEAVPDPNEYQPPPFPRNSLPCHSSRVLPSVGAFTVQCAYCFKWRLIPTKEKYEEIREHILEHPFVCETAHEWRPEISCEDPPDICQDDSMLWAIDKPNIAQPPPGWQRLLRIRGAGSTHFADPKNPTCIE
ncbi:hypothetical protein CsSME_00051707 [Camellia sinensis var. sinensis]